MAELLFVLVVVVAALSIILYATWLFVHQLRIGESKTKSFWEWIKHIFEAIMGL
jgi:hypothetical protein